MNDIDQSVLDDIEIISYNEVDINNESHSYKLDDISSKLIEISFNLLIKFIKIKYETIL